MHYKYKKILILSNMPLFEGISLPFISKNLICSGPTDTQLFSLILLKSRALAPSTLTYDINDILFKLDLSHIVIELKLSWSLLNNFVLLSLKFNILIALCKTPFKL